MTLSVHAADARDAPATAQLLRRAADGDRDALARIVEAHHADMLRVAYVVARDHEVAADAVQQAWLRAATRLGSLRDPARLRPWLCSIAANEVRASLRRRRRELTLTAEGPGPSQLADPSVLDLGVAMARLDPADRALLAMRYVAGFTSAELARELHLSAAGVRSRLKRLLDRLRKEMTP